MQSIQVDNFIIVESASTSKSKRARSHDSGSSASSDGSDSSSSSSSDQSDQEEGEIQGDKNDKAATAPAAAADDDDGQPKFFSTVKAEEVPEIPENRYLMRSYKSDTSNRDEKDGDRSKNDRNFQRASRICYSKSGRKIRGRGLLVSVSGWK